MQGMRQMQRTVTVDATPSEVWSVLADARLLPEWVPVVEEVLACSTDGEGVGTVRTCAVEMGGRTGRIVERCVEFEPMRRVAYLVDEENFGMNRMFADYGFVIRLEPHGQGTVVVVDTHYTPRNPFYALLNRVVMRRQFRKVVDGLLAGLRTLVQSRAATITAE